MPESGVVRVHVKPWLRSCGLEFLFLFLLDGHEGRQCAQRLEIQLSCRKVNSILEVWFPLVKLCANDVSYEFTFGGSGTYKNFAKV